MTGLYLVRGFESPPLRLKNARIGPILFDLVLELESDCLIQTFEPDERPHGDEPVKGCCVVADAPVTSRTEHGVQRDEYVRMTKDS